MEMSKLEALATIHTTPGHGGDRFPERFGTSPYSIIYVHYSHTLDGLAEAGAGGAAAHGGGRGGALHGAVMRFRRCAACLVVWCCLCGLRLAFSFRTHQISSPESSAVQSSPSLSAGWCLPLLLYTSIAKINDFGKKTALSDTFEIHCDGERDEKCGARRNQVLHYGWCHH